MNISFEELCDWVAIEVIYVAVRSEFARRTVLVSREAFLHGRWVLTGNADVLLAAARIEGRVNLLAAWPSQPNGNRVPRPGTRRG